MLDQMRNALPRVALVYGDAGTAGHLREAVAGHVQIVYATAAAEFDAARLADSHATAALLNLDSCEWLDAVESRLHAAGVAVVYNDPEISRTLEGWEQARWLRHLTAKLSGSTDYDPPRPAPVEPVQTAEPAAPAVAEAPEARPVAQASPANVEAPADAPAEVMEQPLSLAEIASMTVNFNAVPEPASVPASQLPSLDVAADVEPDAEPAAEAMSIAEAAEPAGDGALDVDTEALSALIDARLAEAEDHASGDAPQVWRVAHGGSVSAVDLPPAVEPAVATASQETPAAPASPMDDAELMQGLPAIDDWQLVDPNAAVAPAGKPAPRSEPEITIDFAGLELVPIETVAQVEPHVEPIERWMHVGTSEHDAARQHRQPATSHANGDPA